MNAATITVHTQGLSEDGSRVVSGARQEAVTLTATELLAKLTAFAGIPAVDLIDTKPIITVRAETGGEFTIFNEGGTLFLVESPASEHSPMEKSPSEIVQFLDETFRPPVAEEKAVVVVRTSKIRTLFNSPVLLIGLLVVWAGVAYFTLREPGPEGVTLVNDAGRIAGFAELMQGRYGNDQPEGGALYVVEADRFKVFDVTAEGVDAEPVFDVAYTFGQRDGKTVLVLETGAVIGQTVTGDLVFGDETYPKL